MTTTPLSLIDTPDSRVTHITISTPLPHVETIVVTLIPTHPQTEETPMSIRETIAAADAAFLQADQGYFDDEKLTINRNPEELVMHSDADL